MKKGIRILILLNIICYINMFALSYRTSLLGMDRVNPFWLLTPYLFVLILTFPLSRQFIIIRKYGYIDYGIRFLAILINYKASNYHYTSKIYIILTSIVILIFIANIIIEILMYQKCKKYYTDNNLQEPSFKDIYVLTQDATTRHQINAAGGRAFRHWFNWWNLVLSVVGFSMAIVFIRSNKWQLIIIGIIMIVIVPYFTLKSIKSHLKLFDYADYEKEYKKKRKIINIMGVVISFVFAFCISFFGSKDLGYANGLAVIFLMPLYYTEQKALSKSKDELDSILKNNDEDN